MSAEDMTDNSLSNVEQTLPQSDIAKDNPQESEIFLPDTIPNAEFFKTHLAECYDEVLLSKRYALNQKTNPFGDLEFREAIASFLSRFCKISTDPDQIIISAGIEGLLVNILSVPSITNPDGKKRPGLLSRAEQLKESISPRVAISEDGSELAKKLFATAKIQIKEVGADDLGISFNSLLTAGATLLYATPIESSEYSLEDPAERRQELIDWANSASYRYIIEYDTAPEQNMTDTFKSVDLSDKVIYLNSFATLLCKGINASWAVLPVRICDEYKTAFEKFSCPLSYLEQAALTLFLNKGYLDTYLTSRQQDSD